jgi:hypothetical protein
MRIISKTCSIKCPKPFTVILKAPKHLNIYTLVTVLTLSRNRLIQIRSKVVTLQHDLKPILAYFETVKTLVQTNMK